MVPSLVMNNTNRNVSARPSSGANSNPTETGSSNSTKDGSAPLDAPSQSLTAMHLHSGSASPLASTVVPSSFGDSRESAEKLSELLPSPLPSGSASSSVDSEHLGGLGGTIPPESRDFLRPGAEGYVQISGMAASLLPSPLPSGSASSLVDSEHLGGPGGEKNPESRDFLRPDAEGYVQISGMMASLLPSPLPSGLASPSVDYEYLDGPGGTIPPNLRDVARTDAGGYAQRI
jgi:hypothetical protein